MYNLKNYKKIFSLDSIILQSLIREAKIKVVTKIFEKSGYFQKGYGVWIKNLALVPTLKCNQKCIMCLPYPDNASSNFVSTLESPEYFKKIIKETAVFKPDIILTGGEVLLYENWYDIARYAKSLKLRVILETNSFLLEENADKIIEFVDDISISFDSHKEDVNDEIRGLRGAYKKVIQGIKKLDVLKKGRKRPIMNINCTITPMNYKNLSEIVEFVKNLGVRIESICYLHLQFIDRKTILEHMNNLQEKFDIKIENLPHLAYSPCALANEIDINELIREIGKVSKHKENEISIFMHPNLSLDEIKDYYKNSKYIPARFRKCFTPWYSISVCPNGDVFVCPCFKIGNVKNQMFKEYWNSKETIRFRKTLWTDGIFTYCRVCHGIYM